MQSITLKDSTGTDVVFTVVRQPTATLSGILLNTPTGAGMNRTAARKIEVSAKFVSGKTTPVVSVVVPFGSTATGNFVKEGQVSDTRSASQPANAPELARLDASAFAANAAANAQIRDLFDTGMIS